MTGKNSETGNGEEMQSGPWFQTAEFADAAKVVLALSVVIAVGGLANGDPSAILMPVVALFALGAVVAMEAGIRALQERLTA